MANIYYSPENKAEFRGVNTLAKEANKSGEHKITRKQVKSYLEQQEIYTTHVHKKRPKFFTRLTVPGSNWQVDADVAYFDFKSKYRFVLAVQDVFSRKVAVKTLTNIKAGMVTNALMKLVLQLKGTRYMRFDRGGEFANKLMAKALSKTGIKFFFSYEPRKANYVKRFFRTMKDRIFKIMQRWGTRQWQNILPDVINMYNNSKHSSLVIAPADVNNKHGESKLWFKFKQQRLCD